MRTTRLIRANTTAPLLGRDWQVSGTKPATRSDGAALVSGDRWWDTAENREWFWNGTYWLSSQIHELNHVLLLPFSATQPGAIAIDISGNDVFLLSFSGSIGFSALTGFDGSNYYWWRLVSEDKDNNWTTESQRFLNSNPTDYRETFENSINAHRDVSALDIRSFQVRAIKVGTPPDLLDSCSFTVRWRWAKL